MGLFTSRIIVVLNMETTIPDCETIWHLRLYVEPLKILSWIWHGCSENIAPLQWLRLFFFPTHYLLDSDGGKIGETWFNTVVEGFYDVIEVVKVYLNSKGSFKTCTEKVQSSEKQVGDVLRGHFNSRSLSEWRSVYSTAIVFIQTY